MTLAQIEMDARRFRREAVAAGVMLTALRRTRAASAAEAWAFLRREFPSASLDERAAAISRWSAG